YMALSGDSRYLMLVGYNTPWPYSSSLPASSASVVPRAVSSLNGLAYYQLQLSSTSLYSGANIRCATSDGTNTIWTAGSAGNPRYFGPQGTNIVIGSVGNTRVIQFINGQLYYVSASGTYGVHKLTGSGTNLTDSVLVPTGDASSFPADFAFS